MKGRSEGTEGFFLRDVPIFLLILEIYISRLYLRISGGEIKHWTENSVPMPERFACHYDIDASI